MNIQEIYGPLNSSQDIVSVVSDHSLDWTTYSEAINSKKSQLCYM